MTTPASPTDAPLDPIAAEHFERTRNVLLSTYGLARLGDYIEQKTRLGDLPFSFLHHEYQRRIVDDTMPEKDIRKCSQVGISELAVRIALAMSGSMRRFTTIYTLPTAGFSKKFAQTRVDPTIAASPAIAAMVNPDLNNTEIKQIGDSFIYFSGTVGQKAAISVPADAIISDEVDFSDETVLTTYESRLTHSKHKIKLAFSTPTTAKRGISARFAGGAQFWNLVKCHHCGHSFCPDYFEHVKIPGYDGSLREISRAHLTRIRWREAKLLCPRCGREPDLGPQHREWVNQADAVQHTSHGYQIQPFDAPKIVTPADLVKSSTTYKRYVDFTNFSLGLPDADASSGFGEADVESWYVPAQGHSAICVMGLDLGMVCHLVLMGLSASGQRVVFHRERVPVGNLERRYFELRARYRPGCVVSDALPYTETIMRFQARDKTLHAAYYRDKRSTQAYEVKQSEQLLEVHINRNRAFDELMTSARAGEMAVMRQEDPDLEAAWLKQTTDMTRIRRPIGMGGEDDEDEFVWVKSKEKEDHFHHAWVYANVAADIRMAAGPVIVTSLPLVQTVKLYAGI